MIDLMLPLTTSDALRLKQDTIRIGVIGLGYVGLPLAVEFAKKFPTVGFDIDATRIGELNNGKDRTLEVEDATLQSVLKKDKAEQKKGLWVSSSTHSLAACNIYIITVPTPTDKNHCPVLTPLRCASETVGNYLQKGNIVIYESTVYPGVTEEECVPILEKTSGLVFNEDFYCGYSPERINPGDKIRTVKNIVKVTSGSTPVVAEIVDCLYKSIIEAGTFKASSIKVAEASKVIENSQRDINIAFVNELSKIFGLLNIDTTEVLEAASTKWNFLRFTPGLVGGHCIGIDPYYLAKKAQDVGYHPEIILAGRRMNDQMGAHVAEEVLKLMINKELKIKGSKVLILGITFKENCPDIRNTKVIDVYQKLQTYGLEVDIFDPLANREEVLEVYGIDCLEQLDYIPSSYNAVVLAVAHQQFLDLDLSEVKQSETVLFDVKSFLPKTLIDGRL